MKTPSAKNLFDRFAKYLKSIDSCLQIDINMDDNVKRCRIWVKYPATNHWLPWYYCFDMDVDLQLFFLGQNLPNRDALIYNNVISYGFTSILALHHDMYDINKAVSKSPIYEQLINKIKTVRLPVCVTNLATIEDVINKVKKMGYDITHAMIIDYDQTPPTIMERNF